MSRISNAATRDALSAPGFRYVYFISLFLDNGTIRLNTSSRPRTFRGDEYSGASLVGEIGAIEEGSSLDPTSLTIVLNGLDPSLVPALLAGEYVNREASVYFALLDDQDEIIDPESGGFIYFDGFISNLGMNLGKSSALNVSLRDHAEIWSRSKISRYTNEEQQIRHPGDQGFEYVEQIADKEIIWPASGYRG